jgi:hypothetical protein
MFRCQLCGTVVPPRTPCNRVAIRSRRRSYPSRPLANRFVRLVGGKRKQLHTADPGGVGVVIVPEATACPACAANQASGAPVPPSS